jgi:uncharacterized Fe-S cluster-containing radical SAM superfamily protein
VTNTSAFFLVPIAERRKPKRNQNMKLTRWLVNKRIEHMQLKGDTERLATQLQVGELKTRCAAAVSLNRLGDARGREWLIMALDTGTTSARLAAAHSLAVIGDLRGIPLLINVVSDISHHHFRAAYDYLKALNLPWLTPHLIPLLSHEEMTTRIIALRLLKRIGDPHGFLTVLSMPGTRHLCVYDLKEERDPQLVEYLAYSLRYGNADTREFAARQLEEIDGGLAAEILAEYRVKGPSGVEVRSWYKKVHPVLNITENLRLKDMAKRLRPLSFPNRVAVEVSAACNLSCTMCHHSSMQRPKGKMPLELWRKCADQIAAVSPQTKCWFSCSGEPLLEPERLLKMIACGKSAGLQSLSINTNGAMLSSEITEAILESGLEQIVVGIDGFTKETYEKVRVGGNRDAVYANTERLLAMRHERHVGPAVRVEFVEMDENAHEAEAVKTHWLAQGATVQVRHKLSWGGKFGSPLNIPAAERTPCLWGTTTMHLFWDGRIPRCPGDTEGKESPGNAWDEPLTALWNRLGSYRKLHLERRFSELPDRCQRCKDWMAGPPEIFRPDAESCSPPQELVAAGV